VIDVRLLCLTAVVLATSSHPSEAGPCTTAIDQLQGRVDAALDAAAASGPAGREGVGATLHHQPTRQSIARAEESLGEGAGPRSALATLQGARVLDQAGDGLGCQRALEEARRALGR
jgi:hypothetical protein